MAKLLWANVYFQDDFAGILQEHSGGGYTFTYDEAYLAQEAPAIAHTLPKQQAPHRSRQLHPFFDNLVAEGWMENAYTRLLGKREASRFELLMTFGYDCAGAVSIQDPNPSPLKKQLLDLSEPVERALFNSRASLSGIQPKLALIKKGGKFFPTKLDEISTHIAKFPSPGHPNLVYNEYLTTLAFQTLLPQDTVVQMQLAPVEGVAKEALIIKRFDRKNNHKIHFEEFNALLGQYSFEKYDLPYQSMANFLDDTPGCLPAEKFLLFQRLLAGFIVGNTDMHLKNFALFHTPQGYRLTPTYDQVAASLYSYKALALPIANTPDIDIGHLKPKHIIRLSEEFKIATPALKMAIERLAINLEKAKDQVANIPIKSNILPNKIIKLMDKRWNNTFASIGPHLSKKR